MRGPARPGRVAAGLAGVVLAACSANPIAPDARATVASVTVPVARAGVLDGRAAFRETFCAALARDRSAGTPPSDCADLLLRLPDEPRARPGEPLGGDPQVATAGGPRPPPAARPDVSVMFVPGLASDCADQAALIERELAPRMARRGLAFRVLPISGLSSDAANARRLRDAVLAQPEGAPRAILVAHSTGAIDALEMLVAHPETRDRVAALVSLAGAIGGSPLARLASGDALAVAAWSPGLDCDAGDLGGLDSLVPERRQRWLATHRPPPGVRYYSLVAMPDADRISPGLVAGHRLLSRIDPRNDGNVLFHDQVIPAGTLLGYLNADHWSVGSDLAASPKAIVRMLAGTRPFPRGALIESVVETVRRDLGAVP